MAADDPEVAHAVRAWLIARGQRQVSLWCGASPVATGPIAPRDLDTLPAAGVGREASLITLAPSNAEMVAALGAFDRVVAAEDSSDSPPEIETLPRLGPDLAPDLDRVAVFRPGLVVSSLTVPGMERNVIGLRARGVPQIVLAPRSVDDVIADLTRLGAAVGARAAGARAAATLSAERETLRARWGGRHVPVYLEWWPRPMFTPGADCFSNELIALAGGRNVFARREGASVEVTPADVVAAAPEACFVSWCGVAEAKLNPANLCARDGLTELLAVREGRVFALDERYSGRPGPNMLEASRRMAAALHSQ